MHEDDRQACLRGDGQCIGVVRQRRDVVEDVGAGGGGPAHHLGLARIDGDPCLGARAQALDDGDDAAQLFLGGNVLGAGPRRLAADVEDVGAFLGKLQAVRDGRLRRSMQAAVGEAVGRDVDDAHDARPVEGEAGESGARRGDRLEVVRGIERPATPVALDGILQRDDPAVDARAVTHGNFDGRETQGLTRKREPAPGILRRVGGRRKQPDGPHIGRALHSLDPTTKRPRGSPRGRIYVIRARPVKRRAIRIAAAAPAGRCRRSGGSVRRRSGRRSRTGRAGPRRRACG